MNDTRWTWLSGPLRSSRLSKRQQNADRIGLERREAARRKGVLLRSCLLSAWLLGGMQLLAAETLYSVTDLGTLGGIISERYAINNAGQITGYSNTRGGQHGFLYSNGVMTDLGTLPGGGDNYGYGINDAGQITGYAATASGTLHAFLYSHGVMTDLGTLGRTYDSSEGYGINNAGQITGYTNTLNDGYHAFLYSNGVMVDLNTLIDPNLHIKLTEARGINDLGQIVANGNNHAYLLTPVPEPGTLALFGLALLGCGFWVRARRI